MNSAFEVLAWKLNVHVETETCDLDAIDCYGYDSNGCEIFHVLNVHGVDETREALSWK